MLISQDMLRIHQKSLGTYQRMLIGQDMLIASMLIARFNCTFIRYCARHRCARHRCARHRCARYRHVFILSLG